MQPTLPSELVDRILGLLQDDIHSLCRASLASQIFIPCARYHIFSKLTIDGKAAESLAPLLSSPVCTIPTACNELLLTGVVPSMPKWTPELISLLQKHFTTVRESLSICKMADINKVMLKAILEGPGFQGPKKLSIFDCVLWGSDVLEQILTKCRRGVQTLYIYRIAWFPGSAFGKEDFFEQHVHMPTTLRTFAMPSMDSPGILEWIGRHPSSKSLESFSALSLTDKKLDPVQTFLVRTATTLKSCEIGYKLDSGSSSFLPLDFGQSTALERLTIASLNLSSFDLPHMSPAMPSHTVPIITSLKSNVLRHVCFQIQLEVMSWFDVISWDEIDAFLAPMKTLTIVEFVFTTGKLAPGEIKRTVQARMAACHERKILHIQVQK